MMRKSKESVENEKSLKHGRSARERSAIVMNVVTITVKSILAEIITGTVLHGVMKTMIITQMMMVGQKYPIGVSADMIVRFFQ